MIYGGMFNSLVDDVALHITPVLRDFPWTLDTIIRCLGPVSFLLPRGSPDIKPRLLMIKAIFCTPDSTRVSVLQV